MGFFKNTQQTNTLLNEFQKEQQRIANEREDFCRNEDTYYALPDDKDLTAEQKAAVDKFWSKYKILGPVDYTAIKTFYNRSGIFDPRYINTYTNKYVIRPVSSPKSYQSAFQNKAYLPKFLNCRQPETIARRIAGVYYDQDFNVITKDEAIQIGLDVLASGREIVVKPSGACGGAGVEFLSESTPEKLSKIYDSKGRLFVVQKAIHQHPEMAKLNASTVNTVRLTTFLDDGNFIPLAALIKVGAPKVRVDNYKHGGCLLGVNLDGTVYPWAFNIDRKRITELPSGIKLGEGGFTKIPCWDSVLEEARKAHLSIPKILTISWDIAIADDNHAQIIEANFAGDIRMHQSISGPLYGEYTEKFLDKYFVKQYSKKGMTPDFEYEEYNNRIIITKYIGNDSVVTVPSKIEGKPVRAIGEAAFAFNRDLTKVTLPETVTGIRKKAFCGCTNLAVLTIDMDHIKNIGDAAFKWCDAITEEEKLHIRRTANKNKNKK